ncbi:hypothetical protein FEM03_05985 [Phragmitibacter flavus]|uniref:Uncharacterized protein n=1 Tax=Phragmitibacter flavus TaxID=2576071 RepID=A0A5R8KH95_9BACT|nr:hypothetical protein FEM03_05985 [Phragmitibacter flavus]
MAAPLDRKLSFATPLIGTLGEFGVIPPRVAPVFRDEWELRGGGDLKALTEEGLRGSECLIVQIALFPC